MEHGGGRSPEERRAAAEARARAREGRAEPGDDELIGGGGLPARAPEGITRYGGSDYGQRRAIAIGVIALVVVLLLFFLLVGC